MILIVGVIGGLLFIGLGNVIYLVGFVVVLVYVFGGLFILLIMCMLGEMVVFNLDSGLFLIYVDCVIGCWVGFIIGWLYWCFWVLLMGWEVYVVGKIFNSWFFFILIWGYMLVVIMFLVLVNL